jgi:thiamine kinase-like enzyme
MSDKNNLYKKLDSILEEMFRYSFTLGDWGKYIWIVINLRYDGYNVESFGVKPWEIKRFESQKICNACFEDIYLSEYDYTTNSYNINFNSNIRELRENKIKIENIIRNIETLAIDIYNIVINSYLDPSEEYRKISIYFKRNVPNYNKIIEEIKESIIFGHSIPKKNEFMDQPIFTFMALKEKKKDKNDDTIELSYPDYYTFSFIFYRINYQNFKPFLNFL